MPEIITKPDTTWGLECIRERFEIPIEIEPNSMDNQDMVAKKALFIEAVARKAGEIAVEKYTRLRHWKFRDDIPVQIDESDLQFDPDAWDFSSPASTDPIAVDQRMHLFKSRATKAYVIKLWFETQLIQTTVFEPSLDEEGHSEGYITTEEIPKEAVKLLEDTKNASIEH